MNLRNFNFFIDYKDGHLLKTDDVMLTSNLRRNVIIKVKKICKNGLLRNFNIEAFWKYFSCEEQCTVLFQYEFLCRSM